MTSTFSLDLVGILLLAPLDLVKRRIAFRGTASLLDVPLICPGLSTLQDAPGLAKGEFPACAAMTSGYVFRVENEAMVFQLQQLGRPGCLTTIMVSSSRRDGAQRLDPAHCCSLAAVTLAIGTWFSIVARKDWWGVVCLTILLLANLTNSVVIRRRAALGWKGASEPGVQSDLLILLSQDRWIRMRGLTDDVKVVTSGQWLRESTPLEGFFTYLATLLVYTDIVLWKNATHVSQCWLLFLLVISASLIALSNSCTQEFRMYGKVMKKHGAPKQYARRLDLADELIKDTGRKDWAIRLGMIQATKSEGDNIEQGPKIM
jgi:hypothetical protein